MICLPKNLAPLVHLAAKDAIRLAINGIRVVGLGDGNYRCEVTDGRMAAIVQGYPPEGMDATDDRSEAVVPADAWKQAFKSVGKRGRGVGLQGWKDPLLLTADGGGTFATAALEGRFPDIGHVLPRPPCRLEIHVNPLLLARLLDAAACFMEPTAQRVTLRFYPRPGSPMGVSTKNGHGQFFDGLLVPLS